MRKFASFYPDAHINNIDIYASRIIKICFNLGSHIFVVGKNQKLYLKNYAKVFLTVMILVGGVV